MESRRTWQDRRRKRCCGRHDHHDRQGRYACLAKQRLRDNCEDILTGVRTAEDRGSGEGLQGNRHEGVAADEGRGCHEDGTAWGPRRRVGLFVHGHCCVPSPVEEDAEQ